MKYELAIAHRVCPVLAKTAVGFTDKFEMVKVTTSSLARALKGIKTKLFVILDGCTQEYINLFNDTFMNFEGVDYELILTSSIGNAATYAKQLELLSSVYKQAQYLYFSEDDYIYKEYAFKAMIDFFKYPKVNFVTPIDHPDRYSHIVPENQKVKIEVSDYCHWREVGTTCCTFMTTSETFRYTVKKLATYGKGSMDAVMWLGLTKDYIFSPSATIVKVWRYFFGKKTDSGIDLVTVAAWRWHKWRLPFSKKYHLWGPIPTLAVHLSRTSLPPFSEEVDGWDFCLNINKEKYL